MPTARWASACCDKLRTLATFLKNEWLFSQKIAVPPARRRLSLSKGLGVEKQALPTQLGCSFGGPLHMESVMFSLLQRDYMYFTAHRITAKE